jgi:hypothetical protein
MKDRVDVSEVKAVEFSLDELCLMEQHTSREIGEDKAFEGYFDHKFGDDGDEYAEEIAKNAVAKMRDILNDSNYYSKRK